MARIEELFTRVDEATENLYQQALQNQKELDELREELGDTEGALRIIRYDLRLMASAADGWRQAYMDLRREHDAALSKLTASEEKLDKAESLLKTIENTVGNMPSKVKGTYEGSKEYDTYRSIFVPVHDYLRGR